MSLNNFLKVVLLCIVFSSSAYGQQTFNKLNVNELTLPKETAGKVLVLDGNKKAVGATSVTSIELDNLSGSTSNIQTQIDGLDSDITASESNISANTAAIALKADDSLVVHKAGAETITGDKTITGQLTATSTTKGNTTCPVMTDVQMLAVASPRNGDCVYNSTKKGQFVYSSADSKWKPNGGGAGGSRLNLLVDGSFEDGVTEGACTGCTASQESIDVLASPNNEKALKLSFSASAGCYTVDKTTSATFSNVQGLVGAWINTTQAGVTLTTRRNGADTLNVKSIDANGYYTYYEIPDVTGSTSFGYKICATSSITGNIFADEVFLGPAKVTASTGLIGPWTTFTPTGSWTTNTTYTGKYRQVGQNLEVQYGWATSGAPTATALLLNLPTGFTVATSNLLGTAPLLVNSCQIIDAGTANFDCRAGYNTGNQFYIVPIGTATTYGTIGTAVSQSIPQVWASGDSGQITITVPVNELKASTNTLSSTNGNTSLSSCGLTTSDFTGFGTVSNIEMNCYRDGEHLVIDGKFTSGTTTNVEARINLKYQGKLVTSAGSPKIGSIRRAGEALFSASSATGFVNGAYILIEPSSTYLAFGSPTSTTPHAKGNGSVVQASSVVGSINARIPIAGWENSNVIVASLLNTPNVPNVSKPKTCYYGFGGASATLAVPTECTTGTCTEVVDTCGTGTPPAWGGTVGIYTGLTFASGTFAKSAFVKCSCSSYDLTNGAERDCFQYFGTGTQTWSSNSNGGYVANFFTPSAAGVAGDSYAIVKCEGQAPQ